MPFTIYNSQNDKLRLKGHFSESTRVGVDLEVNKWDMSKYRQAQVRPLSSNELTQLIPDSHLSELKITKFGKKSEKRLFQFVMVSNSLY